MDEKINKSLNIIAISFVAVVMISLVTFLFIMWEFSNELIEPYINETSENLNES